MTYRLRWPDARETDCYSPSLVIKDYFEVGQRYPLPLFMTRIREATEIASTRVQAKFGFRCSAAEGQLETIEALAAQFSATADAAVSVIGFGEAS